MKVTLGAHNKLKFIEFAPPSKGKKDYDDWLSENYIVMPWLWNSIEPSVCSSVMFLSTTKEIWESIRETYSIEKKVSRVYNICYFSNKVTSQLVSITVCLRV